MKKLKVAIFGSGSCKQVDEPALLAFEIGKSLAGKGCHIVTGGYAGVMEAASAGAKSVNGKTTGIVHIQPEIRKPNDYVDEIILKQDYQGRMAELLRTKVFVALPGSSGTLAEITAAFALANRHSDYYLAIYQPFWYKKLTNVLDLLSVKTESKRIFWFTSVEKLESWIDSI